MSNASKVSSLATKLTIGATAGAAVLTPFEVLGQDAAPKAKSDTLQPIVVTATPDAGEETNTNNATTQMSRLPGEVKDIPQIVNVIPEKVLEQQNVQTLEQALRNVPGITVAIGEANGGPNGDRFRIRGFESIGDSYRDGLRDFGVYVRDSFNYEQVQVFKGPSSESFGAGTSGGAINTTSKEARLDDFVKVDASLGNGPLARATFDVNKKINDTTAIRVTGMGNKQDIVDRDDVKSDRWGGAVSLGFGLGTDTTWFLDYFHQTNDRTPDFGVPMATVSPTGSGVRKPITEFGVPRSNYYGKDSDRDKSHVDMLTSRLSKEATDWLTVKNDTRLARYDRYISVTPTICGSASTNPTRTATQNCDAVGQSIYDGGNPTLYFGGGSGPTYDQTNWGIQNVTTGIAKFETGQFRHEAVFGLDVSYQEDDRQGFKYVGSKPLQTVWNPNASSAGYSLIENPDNVKSSNSTNVALFGSDRMWLTDEVSVLGGVRWDYYKAHYDQISSSGQTISDANTSFFSPKASVIWEPTQNQTYYASYATAMNVPWGQYIGSDVNAITTAKADLDPETTESFELGAKLNFLDGMLGVTGAVFQVTKDNAYYLNANDVLTATGEKQRVRGIELGLTGKVTEQWEVMLAYAYMNSEILDSGTKADIGNQVAGVPHNSGSLWTTYNLTPHFDGLSGQFMIGGGLTYRDGVSIRSDETAEVPYSLSFDAVVSYETEKWRVGLNGYNLANRVNYDSFFQGENGNTGRAVPSAGRTFVLTVGTTF
jgi:catecholate siderophore receptor